MDFASAVGSVKPGTDPNKIPKAMHQWPGNADPVVP